ncbi:polar amino acid transport system substrate-binding protein [Oxalobacteraceae bacterium GrIS 1.11]
MLAVFDSCSRLVVIALAAAVLALPAAAACSRSITVPVAPTGSSVIVTGNLVSGAYPDMLRELGKKMGCTFVFPIVPRARLAFMFLHAGEADLMLPASRSAERDRQGVFVPMMTLKMAMISLKRRNIKSPSVADLLTRRQWRGIVVRSYAFGDEYNALIQGLDAQRRLFFADNLLAAARMLKVGRADFTVVAPAIFLTAVGEDPAMAGWRGQLEYSALDGLPATESGVYISTRSLSATDQAQLRELLESARKDALWRSFQKYYPADLLQYFIVSHGSR